jgi:hypothetical protein
MRTTLHVTISFKTFKTDTQEMKYRNFKMGCITLREAFNQELPVCQDKTGNLIAGKKWILDRQNI